MTDTKEDMALQNVAFYYSNTWSYFSALDDGQCMQPFDYDFKVCTMSMSVRDMWEQWQPGAELLDTIGPISPLDVEYDGVSLRDLIACDEAARHDKCMFIFTSSQRAAVSRYWSEQLRSKAG